MGRSRRPGRTALLLADPRGNPPLSKDTKVGEAKEGILQRTQDQVSIRLPYVLTLFACLLYHLSDFPGYWQVVFELALCDAIMSL